jgi:hypothetical protein
MAKPPLDADEVGEEVFDRCDEAADLCKKSSKELHEVQKKYQDLIKKKKGKMDPPKITITNCSSGKGGVVPTKWTDLWNSSGKFYDG